MHKGSESVCCGNWNSSSPTHYVHDVIVNLPNLYTRCATVLHDTSHIIIFIFKDVVELGLRLNLNFKSGKNRKNSLNFWPFATATTSSWGYLFHFIYSCMHAAHPSFKKNWCCPYFEFPSHTDRSI